MNRTLKEILRSLNESTADENDVHSVYLTDYEVEALKEILKAMLSRRRCRRNNA
jgi:hypothetical protein